MDGMREAGRRDRNLALGHFDARAVAIARDFEPGPDVTNGQAGGLDRQSSPDAVDNVEICGSLKAHNIAPGDEPACRGERDIGAIAQDELAYLSRRRPVILNGVNLSPWLQSDHQREGCGDNTTARPICPAARSRVIVCSHLRGGRFT